MDTRRVALTSSSLTASFQRAQGRAARAVLAACALVVSACSIELDAGDGRPRGLLPIDQRNPIVIFNDNVYDNWQGEYAVLLANGGGPKLAGIVVGTSSPWPDLGENVAGWRGLVNAARDSGLGDVPDPIASVGEPLRRPSSGVIEDTVPNRSEGARALIEAARSAAPYRPLVAVTGSRLTDVADAYLLDHTIVDRIFVVSSLGTVSTTGGGMGRPNGEMDPWADSIVTSRLRYIQVSAFYDQVNDVPEARATQLPRNPFGDWMAAKQSKIFDLAVASDQVGPLAVGLPGFVVTVQRVTSAGAVESGASSGPELVQNANGPLWLVTQCASALATARLWQLLLDPATFAG